MLVITLEADIELKRHTGTSSPLGPTRISCEQNLAHHILQRWLCIAAQPPSSPWG
jgi:hypothetical protein